MKARLRPLALAACRSALALTALACAPDLDLEPRAEPGAVSSTTDAVPEPGSAAVPFEPHAQISNTASRLQAVSAVNNRVVWASGLDGSHSRTLDGGATWRTRRGAGSSDSETLQFRDIHAFDEETAYLLAAGEGKLSRIYKTNDGGASWQLQFVNLHPDGFLDCFDFWDRDRGLAYGDSVDGALYVLKTTDGSTWTRVPAAALPPAGEGEGGFAASGTCVATGTEGRAWIATGASGNARVLVTEDYAASWRFAEAPVVRGPAAGLMSVVFASRRHGVALGGDLEQPRERTANVAVTDDGGASWTAGGALPFPGAAYGGAWGGSGRNSVLVAAGPGGIATSMDSGRSWRGLSDAETWAVDFGDDDTFWAVGPEGRITRFSRAQVAKRLSRRRPAGDSSSGSPAESS